MKCLVIGATGLVGSAVTNSLGKADIKVYGTYVSRHAKGFMKTDIRDRKSLGKAFEKARPDVALLTAALAWVDYCETHKEEAWGINVEGTKNVARFCKEQGCKMVFISTDYVFDGLHGPYSEEGKPNPINWYGKTKLEGERIVNRLEDHLIIRTNNVFNFNEPKNFVTRLIAQNRKGIEVNVANDQYGNPTFAPNLADAITELLWKDRDGLYNICGKSWVTRYEFSMMLADMLKLDKRLISGRSTEELKQPVRRPKKAGLLVGKAEKELKTRPLFMKECINEYVRLAAENGD
ncbi:MAG: SDR family oxidoreductase [Candidatus Aenigmarchaeota archaeon]|nr:SDR family oxidoreductase [Candidatus Aenigmarchaeota archaeon]